MSETAVSQHTQVERQTLAWAFLLGGFFVCMALVIAIPVGINTFLQNNRRPLLAFVDTNQGTVQITDATGTKRAVLVSDSGQLVGAGASLLTDSTAAALVSVLSSTDQDPLARLQIYSNTILELVRADTPRFAISQQTQTLQANLENGRLRLTLLETQERPYLVLITTPQSVLTLQQPGQYAIEVSNEETQVSVIEGEMTITAVSQTLILSPNQRAEIPNGGSPVGPLDPERNLIRNGDFNDGYEQWSLFAWNIEFTEQPKGETRILPAAGEPTLHFTRQGSGHADARVRQIIDQDVTDYQSLQLFLTFRILNQSLGVCGVQGSECPLFVRVDYIDANGIPNIWQHGFYAVGQVSADTPDICVNCALIQDEHLPVPLGQIYFYTVDLQTALAQQNALPPRFIKNISLIASGHTFEVEVFDVALMAKE